MKYLSSAIGRKQLMAVTGLAWCGFVLTHMLGNLLIFAGADVYNDYSHKLTSNPFIYFAEAGLVLTLMIHVVKGVWLTFDNRGARNSKYAMATNGQKAARFQSRFMIFHGTAILIFVVYHLITFKYGAHYTTQIKGEEVRDIYRLVIEVFQQPAYVAGYVFCMVLVGLHLSHGFASAFSSLGIWHPKHTPGINLLGYIYAIVVALGFISQPLYVYLMVN